MSIVFEDENDDITGDINSIREHFKSKNVTMGISESTENRIHFVKVFCSDLDYSIKVKNMFYLYMAEALYKIAINEYCNNYLYDFIYDNYFFLREDEINDIMSLCIRTLKCEDKVIDDNILFIMNVRNNIIQKILECIEENDEINIRGFIRFRMNQICDGIESIIDKVVEKYMVEKEYNEFIKLLKYFVDLQESKIDMINLVVDGEGRYKVLNSKGEDILQSLINDICDFKSNNSVSMEDVIISALITNSPERIVIHCVENSLSQEFIDTIKNVFDERVTFCEGCTICSNMKHLLKI